MDDVDSVLKFAFEIRDIEVLGHIVDNLREEGVMYQQVFSRARRLTGITAAEWDSLMWKCDAAEGEK